MLAMEHFPLKQKNIGLKHLVLTKYYFETELYLFFWGGASSAWIMVTLGLNLESCLHKPYGNCKMTVFV